MARIKLDDVIHEGDPLISTDFLVEMDVPFDVSLSLDSVLNVLSGKTLSVRCQSVNIPEKTVATQTVYLFGHSYKFRGKREEAPALELTFMEGALLPVYQTLYSWFEYTNKSNNGNSPNKISKGNSEGYSTNIYVTALTTTGERSSEFVFYNAWIKSTPQIQFSGDGATPVQLSASFEYDYFAINPGVNIPGVGNIPSVSGAIRRIRGLL